MTDWTEPDRSEERWSQPWEEWGWSEDMAGPEYHMAYLGAMGYSLPAYPSWRYVDFYTPRARWVSDR